MISLPISFIIWVQINKHLQLFVVRFFWIEIRPLQVLRPWSNFLIFKCPQRFQAQIRDNSKLSHFCLVHLPRKIFLSWTILKLSWTKKFSRVKNSIFCFQKSFKMNISCWKQIFKALPIMKFHFNWLLKAKNGLCNPGQNFCPGQFQNCPGQKIFYPGRWTRQ